MPGQNIAPEAAPGDEIDALFDYGVDEDELFRDFEPNMAAPAAPALPAPPPRAVDLGIDEEITVKKTRVPIAKLDENRCVNRTDDNF